MALELGGILMGRPFFSPPWQCHWTYVSKACPIESNENSGIHVRFSAEAIAHTLAREEQMDRRAVPVGWYHSHPRLGSHFMSATDIKTHQSFYPEPWHLAMVIDPTIPSDGDVNIFYCNKHKSLTKASHWLVCALDIED
jgi:proteasome lid subunit RPN8/RPN11